MHTTDLTSKDTKGDESKGKRKKDAWKKACKKVGWTTDPNDRQGYSPKLIVADFQIVDEMSYVRRFLPMTYISDVILSESNKVGSFAASMKEFHWIDL